MSTLSLIIIYVYIENFHMSHVLSNWEQVHADNIAAEERTMVLWPRGCEGRDFTNAAIWEYQQGIVFQKGANE